MGVFLPISAALVTGTEKLFYKAFVGNRNDLNFALLWFSFSSLYIIPWIFIDVSYPSGISSWALAFISGLFWTLGSITNFKSYPLLEISIKTLVSRSKILFVILLSVVFLKEELRGLKLCGILLILSGIMVVTYVKVELAKYRKSYLKGLVLSFTSALCFGVALTIDKHVSPRFSAALYVALMYMISTLIIFTVRLTTFKKSAICRISKQDIKGPLIASIFGVVGNYLVILAYRFYDATIVVPILESGVVVSLIGGFLIFNERNSLLRKIVACLMILAGVNILVFSTFHL